MNAKDEFANAEVHQAEAETSPDAEAVAQELAKLSKLKYDQCREKEAKRLGVRTKTLDDAVRRYQGEEEGNRYADRLLKEADSFVITVRPDKIVSWTAAD